MISADLEQALATGQVLAALSALGAGVAVLLSPKGTHARRPLSLSERDFITTLRRRCSKNAEFASARVA
jgi:hypothetical protein